MIAYKHVRGDYTDFYSGKVNYGPPYPRVVEQDDCDPPTEKVCGRGLHANIRRLDGLYYLHSPLTECHLLEVEAADSDIICRDEDKLRCKRLTVLRELSDPLGPQTEQVKAFLAELPTWPWLKPQTQDAAELARLAFAAVDTANSYSPVVCKRVRFVTWNVA
ncbi:MAG: hypothetical protein PHI12_14435, partial [Dehalococcoidales bacterium]|nr:hypothetical protein [Dehalococcoidales bacterium]